MNTIKIPGFTAQAALPKPRKAYYSSGVFNAELDLAIPAQLQQRDDDRGGGKQSVCAAGCLGTYIREGISCATDRYPEICRSNAENRYNRCLTRCRGGLFGGGFGFAIA
jgi:hypothetical protein